MFLHLVLPFYLGIVAQAFLLIEKDFEKSDIFGFCTSLIAALIGFIPGRNEDIYGTYGHLLLVSVIFSILYAGFFRKKLLGSINKEIVAIWNFIFLYVIFQYPLIVQNPILLAAIVLPSLLVVLNLFLSFDSRYFWKVGLYIWFLVMIVGIGSFHFAFDKIDFFFTGDEGAATSPVEMFLVGASFLYLVINFWYIISLIPFPGKNQTFEARLLHVKRDMRDFASEYQSKKISGGKILLLIALATVLIANFFYHLMPESLLIPSLIVLGPLFLRENRIIGQF